VEVVARCREVGISELTESQAIFAAVSEQVERGVHESRARSQTGLATLIRSPRLHASLSCVLKRGSRAQKLARISGVRID
jgi:hypothetical protein